MPEIGGYLTPKLYVDKAFSNSIDEPSLLRLDLDEILKLDEQDSIILNYTLATQKTKIETPNKNYVDFKFDDTSIIKKHR